MARDPRTTIRVGTFNVENLFARYNFKKNFDPTEDGFTVNDLAFEIYDETEKQITAGAIAEIDADILALQEVESLPVLDRFASQYLAKWKYKYKMLIDGHDPRAIDVAVLSRYPIVGVRSHRDERDLGGSAFLFSRDCLEVDVDVGGKLLHLYVNHFKSMMGGRDETHDRRKVQVNRVAEILDDAWGKSEFAGNGIVLGDFNDYLTGKTSLTALAGNKSLVNIIEGLPAAERWTHYFAREKSKSQLDYMLMFKPFYERAGQPVPGIMRRGLPWRVDGLDHIDRLPGVGEDNPKASDHAPFYVDIPVAALK